VMANKGHRRRLSGQQREEGKRENEPEGRGRPVAPLSTSSPPGLGEEGGWPSQATSMAHGHDGDGTEFFSFLILFKFLLDI
jgi:hypothetical protein